MKRDEVTRITRFYKHPGGLGYKHPGGLGYKHPGGLGGYPPMKRGQILHPIARHLYAFFQGFDHIATPHCLSPTLTRRRRGDKNTITEM